jgi:hypothetical protein
MNLAHPLFTVNAFKSIKTITTTTTTAEVLEKQQKEKKSTTNDKKFKIQFNFIIYLII